MKPGHATLLLLLIAFFTLNFQCGKDIYLPVKHEFAEKLQLNHVKKTYSLNDTIWVELLKTDKRLFDAKSNQIILMDTSSLSAGIQIKGLYNTPTASFGDFTVMDADSVHIFNHDNFGIHVQKLCSEPDFHFRIGYIIKSRGYYAMSVGSNSVTSCNAGNAPLTSYSSIRYTFDIADAGRDVYLELPESVRKQYTHTWLDYGIDSKNVFVFRVD